MVQCGDFCFPSAYIFKMKPGKKQYDKIPA